ncbi:hypothetical protein FDT66_13335 [Polaribacter aestuariivivens]|uniref:Uncharacterized protein n=1 Tax=Polaribacter aestuariivivens TaxID=2304626 RepID=A0A5S3N2D4_9FLAO|nr:DUF6252 family protein [Polaribacter aestuariivivens]TMM28584.1 hypothetical protein FDT66_13335 [Polaribacter aestuariivivens]
MKKILLLIGIVFSIHSCSEKNETELTPLEQLPKATKVGANTAGCLVNGEAFLPKGFFPSGNLICYFINQENFSLDIANKDNSNINSVFIAVENLNLTINKVINLNTVRSFNDSKFAEYTIFRDNGNDEKYTTTPQITGELIITHHDYNNAIISGTFWFDAINNIGEKVEVREGRFDMKY